MRILVTGNMAYVGSALSRYLRHEFPQAELIGFDSGFFGHALVGASTLPETCLDRQVFGDIRDLPAGLLNGVDAVVHLAAVSNDPMGKEFEEVTAEVNQQAALRIAGMAAAAGVRNFVFASSCSMYGFAEGGARRESDPTNPLTAYARSKIGTEDGLRRMALGDMTATALRFATACGMSDRLRLDLVLNDFVAGALTSGEITVLSDGTPWRPLIDVEDMCRAIVWAIGRPAAKGGQMLSVNAGSSAGNYQVRELAEAVAARVPGTRVSINTDAPPDKRSYKVDFALFEGLAPEALPRVPLGLSIERLAAGLRAHGFADRDFRNSQFIRLKMLTRHIQDGRLGRDLRWRAAAADLAASA